MNLLFRFFWLLASRFFSKHDASILDPCHTEFRVWPTDLDLNFHVNNGKYLSIMDLGRFDLLLKGNVFGVLFRAGFYPVVASESIRFRKSLGLFQRFTLTTQIESWDEKDFYILQTFKVGDTIYAEGYIKGRFRKRGQKQSVKTGALFEFVGLKHASQKMSPLAQAQKKIESRLGSVK